MPLPVVHRAAGGDRGDRAGRELAPQFTVRAHVQGGHTQRRRRGEVLVLVPQQRSVRGRLEPQLHRLVHTAPHRPLRQRNRTTRPVQRHGRVRRSRDRACGVQRRSVVRARVLAQVDRDLATDIRVAIGFAQAVVRVRPVLQNRGAVVRTVGVRVARADLARRAGLCQQIPGVRVRPRQRLAVDRVGADRGDVRADQVNVRVRSVPSTEVFGTD